ncbi:suppressor of fused domain protein [Pseudonocardia acaciae]|uniref:suppressor of fused domain protein n=1 Tax=Pseudonocardia acaciae TaxID=551276 RepID=UPI00048D9EA9|nr:suppressor of fused domain protein [Pseudonocardia acaciae]
MTSTRAARFLAHLDRLSGGVEPTFHPIEPSTPGGEKTWVIAYRNLADGLLTGITYGLSSTDHPDWRFGRPELIINVASTDISWALAIGHLVDRLRGDCPFSYGNTIDFGVPIAPDSTMSAFMIFAPSTLDPEDSGIDVGDEKPINLSECYPIHDSELRYIAEHGLEAFWKLDWELYDVTRPPADGA